LGFRIVLVGDAVISAAFLFGYSLFRPDTPHLVIFVALLAGGFFRSLQMTSINTLSYADMPPAMLSRATSLTSMAQRPAGGSVIMCRMTRPPRAPPRAPRPWP
jgi:hypothetical protein